MSNAFLSLAFRARLKSGPKFVLVALCDFADQRGECFPSTALLAARTSFSRRAVQSNLSLLEGMGIVRRAMRPGRSSVFSICAAGLRLLGGEAKTGADEEDAPPGAKPLQGGCADHSPITPSEPSYEPSPNLGDGAPPRKAKRGKAYATGEKRRGGRIAPDWSVGADERDFAAGSGFSDPEIDAMADRFRDYWLARAGAGGIKLDWSATWRNWVRREEAGRGPARNRDQDRHMAQGHRSSGNGFADLILGRTIDRGSDQLL